MKNQHLISNGPKPTSDLILLLLKTAQQLLVGKEQQCEYSLCITFKDSRSKSNLVAQTEPRTTVLVDKLGTP